MPLAGEVCTEKNVCKGLARGALDPTTKVSWVPGLEEEDGTASRLAKRANPTSSSDGRPKRAPMGSGAGGEGRKEARPPPLEGTVDLSRLTRAALRSHINVSSSWRVLMYGRECSIVVRDYSSSKKLILTTRTRSE